MNDTADHLETLRKLQRMLSLHLWKSENKEYAIKLNVYAIKREFWEHNDAQRTLMSCIAWRNEAIQQQEHCY